MKVHCAAILLLAKPTLSIGVGYNSECRLDNECRAGSDALPDICCALLIYTANGVSVKKHECLPRSQIESAKGAYSF